MRARTFRVPFSRVAPEAVELEWGPEDYIVVRPLLTKSPGELATIHARLAKGADGEGAETDRQTLLLEVLSSVVIEWHLDGESGPIPRPVTWADIDALPSGLGGALFDFLFTYRGDGPEDPTTAGAPS